MEALIPLEESSWAGTRELVELFLSPLSTLSDSLLFLRNLERPRRGKSEGGSKVDIA